MLTGGQILWPGVPDSGPGANKPEQGAEKTHSGDPGAGPVHRLIQMVACATVHWYLRACCRIKKGKSRVWVRGNGVRAHLGAFRAS